MIRARYPLCQDPFGLHHAKGETVSSEQVHHIKGLSEAPELAFLPSNLMAVCCRCHAKLERKEIAR
jgi:5-methylcytosine-specific restriction endonuclease McrA